VVVDYGTIVNGRTRTPKRTVLGIGGPADAPTSIDLPRSTTLRHGELLVLPPGPTTPDGVRGRVLGVQKLPDRLRFGLDPLELVEALPRFSLGDDTILRQTGTAAALATARAKPADTASLDFRKVFTCSVPLDLSEFLLPTGTPRVSPDISVDVAPWSAKKHVRLAVNLITDLGLGSTFLPPDVSCGASLPLELEANVAGFPVVFAISFGIEVGTGANGLGFNVGVRQTTRLGFEWRDGRYRNLSTVSITPKVSAGASLRLSLPKISTSVGLGNRTASISLGADKSLDFSIDPQREKTCRIDWVEDAEAAQEYRVGPVTVRRPQGEQRVTNKLNGNCVPHLPVTPTPTPEPAPQPQPWTFDTGGYGPVRIGARKSDVERLVGKRLETDAGGLRVCWWPAGQMRTSPTYVIDPDTDRVTAITFYDGRPGATGPATSTGLKIGDPLARALSLYGSAARDTGNRVSQGPSVIVKDPASSSELGIHVGGNEKDDLVGGFAVGQLSEEYCA
jgi:hypothetical protein